MNKGLKNIFKKIHLNKVNFKTHLKIIIIVPALYIDGIVLIESLPIVEYLDETRPDPLLPLFGNSPL